MRFISRYNDAYFCTIFSVTRDFLTGHIIIHVTVMGDESLGELQRPSDSTLTSDGTPVPLTSEDVLEDTPCSLTAVLVYTCPLEAVGGALKFTYGSGGYTEVSLEGV